MWIFDSSDAVKETRSATGAGIVDEAFSNVLSQAEEFSMKGLGSRFGCR